MAERRTTVKVEVLLNDDATVDDVLLAATRAIGRFGTEVSGQARDPDWKPSPPIGAGEYPPIPPVLSPRERKLRKLLTLRADTAWTASAAEREGFKGTARVLWRKVSRIDRKVDRLTKTNEGTRKS